MLVNDVAKDANTDTQQVTVVENIRLASDTDIIIKSKKDIGVGQLTLASSLGEATYNDGYHILIRKGSKIPISSTYTFTTPLDNQINCNNNIRFGENLKGSLNNPIGEFAVSNLPPLPKERVGLITTFSVDEYGILTVTVKVRETGNTTIQKFNIENLVK